jgi:hypothetical protein
MTGDRPAFSRFRPRRQSRRRPGSAGMLGPIWIHALMEAGASVLARRAAAGHDAASSRSIWRQSADGRHRGCARSSLERALDTASRTSASRILVNNAASISRRRPAAAYGSTDSVRISRGSSTSTPWARCSLRVFGGRMAEAGRERSRQHRRMPACRPIPACPTTSSGSAFLKPPAYGAVQSGARRPDAPFAAQWRARCARDALSPGGVRGRQDARFIE